MIGDSIFNRIISRYTGAEGATLRYSTPQGGYPTPGTQMSYPAPGTPLGYPTPGMAMPSWRTSAYGTAAAPVPEAPGLFSRAAGSLGTLLTSGIGLLNRGAPATAPGSVPYTGPNDLFGAGGGPAPAVPAPTTAATVGRGPGLGVSNYGQFAKGLPAFASENRAEILKRNII